MKHAIVTGCAGFIGSSLSKRLLGEGYKVTGLDCFTDNYDKKIKESNLQPILQHQNFTMISKNILDINWNKMLHQVDYIFHQAAIPGVRTSWGQSFDLYVRNNILATQLLLEAAKEQGIKKFIYASSSSIYGITNGSTPETKLPMPHSPYGVTKLAGEQLCHLYAANYGVPAISLRYFTVYGPGQRPDMAFHKFIHALLKGDSIPVYGDGSQTRDFTFVEDVVEANLLAMKSGYSGEFFNIGGKSRVVLQDVIYLLGQLTGAQPQIEWLSKQAGDPPHTWADIEKAEKLLGYAPKVSLEDGLREEIGYIKKLYQ